jgi:hypothetical protein
MEIKRGKAKAILIALFLTLTIAITLVALPAANAQSSGEVASYAFVVVAPNPVGVSQTTYVSMFVDYPLPSSAAANDIRRIGYKLTITDPDGEEESWEWDTIEDTTGVEFMSYTPAKAGTYTIEFEYEGQVYDWGGSWNGVHFLPATATTTLTVQEEEVLPTPETPLPTEYWTRPIYGQNSGWYVLGSHWLGGSQFGTFQQTGYNLWQQGGSAPSSSHVMWTTPIEAGGVVGGTNTAVEGATYYSGGSYEGRFGNAIILDGRIYYKAPLSDDPDDGPYVCMDLRTGETLWENEDIYPTFGELLWFDSPNQHGIIPNGYLWQTSARGVTPNAWYAYDPLTGKNLFNVTNIPSGTTVYTENGEIVIYVFDYDTESKSGWMALWNWTIGGTGSGYNAYSWRPVGTVIDGSDLYSWNVTIDDDLTGSSRPSIQAILPGDIILGSSSSIAAGVEMQTGGTADPYTVWALSDDPDTRGNRLWIEDYSAPSGNISRRLGPVDPVNRVWTMTDSETMQWLGYDLDSGDPLWGPTDTEMRGMQFFSSGSGAGQRAVTAYGNIYVQGYGGEIFCYNTTNGNLLWKYNNTNSGVDTSWGLMPILLAAVADGKVYAFNNEHSPNSPYYKGYCVYALNATTGEEIFKMLGWAGTTGGRGTSTCILADGCFVYYNFYDNQIWCVGKGPSDTSVAASPKVSTEGDKVLVEGTVIDIAAGTTQHEQAARFPDGVPAVSDANMSRWMEYVYMQQPMPDNVVGVEVIISVLDPNNNCYEVARTNSDASGFFSVEFEPEVPGKYTVIATFVGSESYYGSSAETAVFVEEAPQPTPTATPVPQEPVGTYFTISTVLIIVAIAIVAFLLLRRR